MTSPASTRCPSSMSTADDLARDLGRHRGLAPRDDVAGRVEDRSNGRRRRRTARGGSDFRCGGAPGCNSAAGTATNRMTARSGDGKADGAGAHHQPRAPRRVQRSDGLLAVEPQLFEQRRLIGHRRLQSARRMLTIPDVETLCSLTVPKYTRFAGARHVARETAARHAQTDARRHR